MCEHWSFRFLAEVYQEVLVDFHSAVFDIHVQLNDEGPIPETATAGGTVTRLSRTSPAIPHAESRAALPRTWRDPTTPTALARLLNTRVRMTVVTYLTWSG